MDSKQKYTIFNFIEDQNRLLKQLSPVSDSFKFLDAFQQSQDKILKQLSSVSNSLKFLNTFQQSQNIFSNYANVLHESILTNSFLSANPCLMESNKYTKCIEDLNSRKNVAKYEYNKAVAEMKQAYKNEILELKKKHKEEKDKELDILRANQRDEIQKIILGFNELIKSIGEFKSLERKEIKSHKNTKLTLRPCITDRQIEAIHKEFAWLFDATIEQWKGLFSEQINITHPILFKGKYISDIRNFIDYLKAKKLIEAKCLNSTIGKCKAFEYNKVPITSKQLNALTGIPNFPEIGNWIKIQEIIDSIAK